MKTTTTTKAQLPVKIGTSAIRHRIVRQTPITGRLLACGRKRRYGDYEEALRDARECKRYGNKHVWVVVEDITVLDCYEVLLTRVDRAKR